MLRAAVCRAAPCRALLRPPSLVKLRLDSSFHRPSVKLATAAPSFCTSRPIHTTYRPRITGAIELSQRSFSSKPTQSSSVPSTSSSPPPTPHVDLLSKYERRAERRRAAMKWGGIALIILALIALAIWFGEGNRASKEIMESVGALQDPSTHKEPPLYHLRKLYERSRTNEHWMQAVRAETVGLLEILRPYLDSANKDERIYASLLVSYIAGGSRALKRAVIDGGYIDIMLKYPDTPTRVAVAITLSEIATRWFAGEMKAIFRDNEGIVNFLKEAAEEHEPLLQAYAKKILYHTGQRSLGRQLSASTELLIKAFDYTQKTDKEAMTTAMRDCANGEPKNAYIQFCQGYWFHLMGFAKEAKIAYTKSLRLNPGQIDALYELGRLYLVEFHADRTAVLWSRAIQENPNFAPINRWLAEYEARPQDNMREDVAQLHRTLTALRAGTNVSIPKAAPLLPAELMVTETDANAKGSALTSLANAVAPTLAAGTRPQHPLPPNTATATATQ